MKWVLAVIVLGVFVLLIDVVDRLICKFLNKRHEKEVAEITIKCNQTEVRADAIGQQIIEAMEDVDKSAWMTPEQKQHFLSRYQGLLDSVSGTKQDVITLRDSLK